MNVALLRAINVGVNRKVPMADLRALFTELGARDVRTCIQSGNVIYDGELDVPTLESGLLARFGFPIPVVVRTAPELAALRNPWPDADPAIVGVAFLSDAPGPAGAARLDPTRIAPDELQVHGRDLWMRCPSTFAKTKITVDWIERMLGGRATIRNARTAGILADMANGRG